MDSQMIEHTTIKLSPSSQIFSGVPVRDFLHQLHLSQLDHVEVLRHLTQIQFNKEIEALLIEDDQISIEFFSHLQNYFRVHIKFSTNKAHFKNAQLTESEVAILTKLEAPTKHISDLYSACQERVSNADNRTAYQILSRIPIELRNEQINQLLSHCMRSLVKRNDFSQASLTA